MESTIFRWREEKDDAARIHCIGTYVDNLHSDKNEILDSQSKQGERIGYLEVETAVQENEILTIKECVVEIKKSLESLGRLKLQVAGIVGGITTIGLFIQKYF